MFHIPDDVHLMSKKHIVAALASLCALNILGTACDYIYNSVSDSLPYILLLKKQTSFSSKELLWDRMTVQDCTLNVTTSNMPLWL